MLYYVETKVAAVILMVEYEAIKKAIKRGSDQYQSLYIKGGGRGGKKLLVAITEEQFWDAINHGVTSDAIAIFDKYGQKTVAPSPKVEADDGNVADLPTASSERRILHKLSGKKQSKLENQIQILKEYEKYRLHRGTIKGFLEIVAEHHGIQITEQTFFRWVARYKKGGAAELASRHGEHRVGKTKLSEWMQRYILERFRTFGTGEFNFTQLWDELHHEAHRMGLIDYYAWKSGKVKNLCHADTPQNFINQYYSQRLLEYSLITIGQDKTKSRLQPAQGNRKEQFTQKNQCWEIDSSPLDVIITVDGKQMRPDILSIVDVYSGRFVMDMADNSNALAIVRLFWKALTKFGKPDMVKGDNGKDYLSRQFQWLLEGLGIKYDAAIAFAGDQKGGVERKFRTMQHSYMQTTIGYIGANVGHRSMIEARIAKKDRKAKGSEGQNLMTQTPHELLPTYEEMEAILEEATILWEIDTKRVKGGVSAIDKWNACMRPIESVPYEEFIIHAGGQEERSLGKQGISFDGRTYKGVVVDQYRNRYKKVLVCENIDNIQELFIFAPDGEFLGVAFDEATKPMVAEDFHGAVRSFNREVRAARKLIAESQLSVHARASVFEELKEAKAAHKKMLKHKEVETKNFDIAAKFTQSRSANVAKVATERATAKVMSYAQMMRGLKHG